MTEYRRQEIVFIIILFLFSWGFGFLTAYIHYQPQIRDLWIQIYDQQKLINELKEDFEALELSITPPESREWYEAYSLEGTGDNTSNTFQIKGDEIRLRWNMVGKYADSGIIIDIKYENGTTYAYRGCSGYYFSGSCDIAIVQPGNYYLEIITIELDTYWVVVWDHQ